MEGVPVAQMNNGQPYIGPPTPEADSGAVDGLERESLRALAADVSTVWSTATVTSVEVQTSIITSVIVTVSTSIEVSTSIVNVFTSPSALDPNSNLLSSATNTNSLLQSTGSTKTSGLSLTTPLIPIMSSNSSSGSSLYMTNPSASNILPAASKTDSPNMAQNQSNQEDLSKVMAGLIVGIFLTAALLSFGLYIFRKREEKHSEIEAANTAERQQQPLINEPIVPYSSAYGTESHN